MRETYSILLRKMEIMVDQLDNVLSDLLYVQNNMYNAFALNDQALYKEKFANQRDILQNTQNSIRNKIIPEISNRM